MLTMTQIRSRVRSNILYALEQDLKCGELLMKEVWEECETEDHVDAAKRELQEIIDWLRERQQRLAED